MHKTSLQFANTFPSSLQITDKLRCQPPRTRTMQPPRALQKAHAEHHCASAFTPATDPISQTDPNNTCEVCHDPVNPTQCGPNTPSKRGTSSGVWSEVKRLKGTLNNTEGDATHICIVRVTRELYPHLKAMHKDAESLDLTEDLMHLDMGTLYRQVGAMDAGKGAFGWIPTMASSSVGQLALSAESYCERILSCANNVFDERQHAPPRR